MKKIYYSLLVLFFTANSTLSAPHVTVLYDTSPQAYFKILFAILILVFTVISYLIWFKVGKDDIVIPVVHFYPPNNINPAEAEFAYKGAVSEKGLSSMIIYLASKGYIDIKEEGESYSIVRLKEPFLVGNPIEKAILKALNPFNYSFVTKEDVRSSYIFYDTVQNIIKDLNSKKHLIFYINSINIVLQSIMLILLLGIIGITVVFWFGFKHPDINGIILGFICTIISSICTYNLPKRNNNGLKLLGALLGLKHFIEVAKKHELEMLVKDNPNYFYDILPYAYILDVSDKWIKKFENITVLDPKWLVGNKLYTPSNLNKINYILNYLNQIK